MPTAASHETSETGAQAEASSAPEIKLWKPVAWLVKYLQNANKPTNKRFDYAAFVGPTYSRTMSFALGGGLTGSYSWDRSDSTLDRSHVTLFLNASVNGMIKGSVSGTNYMPHDRQRWSYDLKVELLPMHFWGLGYKNGVENANKGSYDQVKFSFTPNYLFRVAPSFFVGPQLTLQTAHTYNFSDVSKLQGQSSDIETYGIGAVFQYDTRDFALNAFEGQYFRVQQMVYPKFANRYYFNSTDLTFDSFHRAWRGAVIAMDLHAQFLYGNVPWTMYSLVGVNGRMRGYYEGRYRDRDILEAQVELRQHLFGRFGAVVWVGAANVFHDVGRVYWNQTLPSYGVGARWEFKKRVNIRFDMGFTKNKPGFEFKLNEAF